MATAREGLVGSRSRKQTGSRVEFYNLKVFSSWPSSPARPRCSTVVLKSDTSWGARVQAHEPVEDISYWNHTTVHTNHTTTHTTTVSHEPMGGIFTLESHHRTHQSHRHTHHYSVSHEPMGDIHTQITPPYPPITTLSPTHIQVYTYIRVSKGKSSFLIFTFICVQAGRN